MSTSTSSAIPNDLSTYSRIALTLDGDIAADAGRLAGAISRFESTCRESSFRVPAGHMPPVMARFARDAEPADRWVNTVASGFLAADSGGLRAPGLPSLPWIWRFRPGRPWMPWIRLPWVRLLFIPRRSPIPAPGFQTRRVRIGFIPLPPVSWWLPLPRPTVPSLPVARWQWRRPPWLFVKTWIWLLLPIKIWKWLPWFPPIAPIFRPMPIFQPIPWPPRLWRPIVPWFPGIPFRPRVPGNEFFRPIDEGFPSTEAPVTPGMMPPPTPAPTPAPPPASAPVTPEPIDDVVVQMPENLAELYKMIEDMPDDTNDIRIVATAPGEYLVLLKGTESWRNPESWNNSGADWPDNIPAFLLGKSDYSRAVLDALEYHGIPPGAKLHFAGHSQGGLVAQNLAGDARLLQNYSVGSVTSFGMPIVVPSAPDSWQGHVAANDLVFDLIAGLKATDAITNPLMTAWNTGKLLDNNNVYRPTLGLNLVDQHGDYENIPGLHSKPIPFDVDRDYPGIGKAVNYDHYL